MIRFHYFASSLYSGCRYQTVIVMSIVSSRGLIDGVDGLDSVDGLLNLPASFFIIKSPFFSAAFLPSLSPACEIPDSSAFLANGLTTVLPNLHATFLIGLRILSTIIPLPLCLYTNLPCFGWKNLINSYRVVYIITVYKIKLLVPIVLKLG